MLPSFSNQVLARVSLISQSFGRICGLQFKLSVYAAPYEFNVYGFTGGTPVLIEPSSKPALICSMAVFTSAGTSCSRS